MWLYVDVPFPDISTGRMLNNKKEISSCTRVQFTLLKKSDVGNVRIVMAVYHTKGYDVKQVKII
jgi:hypothetical protein